LTTGTAQPVGFTEWSGFYTFYEVVYSKITVTAFDSDNSLDIAVCPSTIPEPITTEYSTIAGNRYANYSRLNLVASGAGPARTSVVSHIAPKAFFGVDHRLVEPFVASFGANPSFTMFWAVAVRTQISQMATFSLRIRIEFTTRMFGRRVYNVDPTLTQVIKFFPDPLEPGDCKEEEKESSIVVVNQR